MSAWGFTDESISEVSRLGFMIGTDKGFEPESILARAQIITIIWRMDGSPIEPTSMRFVDVSDSAWYAVPIAWAANHGIAQGAEGLMRPNAVMTREELAEVLYRHSEEEWRSPLKSNITDGSEVSTRATIAVEWALASDLMTTADGVFAPKAIMSRGNSLLEFSE